MCIVSNMGDYWKEQLPEKHPWVIPYVPLPPNPINPFPAIPESNGPTREEFEALKKEMQELKKLLIAAKEYDKNTGEPDCELDEKIALIKKVAELVGVDFTKVFK